MHALTVGSEQPLHGLHRVLGLKCTTAAGSMHRTTMAKPPSTTATATASSAAIQASQPECTGMRRPCVYVYDGDGAGIRCAASAVDSLRQAFQPSVQVRRLHTHALLSGSWEEDCILLVMPGGADLPYCKHLNGRGNARIRAYVEQGGSYLGLCAGAYYGTGRVEFEEGGGVMGVVGDRELGFWPYTARGAAYAGFDYASERGAVAAPITFLADWDVHAQATGPVHPYSVHSNSSESAIQQELRNSSAHQGSSSSATMPTMESGAHRGNGSPQDAIKPRMEYHLLQEQSRAGGGVTQWSHCVDYCNGGPVFVGPSQHRQASLQHPGDALPTPTQQQGGTAEVQHSNTNGVNHHSNTDGIHSHNSTNKVNEHSNANRITDYGSADGASIGSIVQGAPQDVAGGMAGDMAGAPRCGPQYPAAAELQLPAGCSVLATYDDVGPGAAAAVRCGVGRGVAVLCGTHPELHPSWLALPQDIASTDSTHSAHSTDSTEASKPTATTSSIAAAAAAAAATVETLQTAFQAPPAADGSQAHAQQGDMQAQTGSADGHALHQHVAALTAALYASQQRREAFWHMLLAACCVTFRPKAVALGHGGVAGEQHPAPVVLHA